MKKLIIFVITLSLAFGATAMTQNEHYYEVAQSLNEVNKSFVEMDEQINFAQAMESLIKQYPNLPEMVEEGIKLGIISKENLFIADKLGLSDLDTATIFDVKNKVMKKQQYASWGIVAIGCFFAFLPAIIKGVTGSPEYKAGQESKRLQEKIEKQALENMLLRQKLEGLKLENMKN